MENKCYLHDQTIENINAEILKIKIDNNLLFEKIENINNKLDKLSNIPLKYKNFQATGFYNIADVINEFNHKIDILFEKIEKLEPTKDIVLDTVNKYKVEIHEIMTEYKESITDNKIHKTSERLQLIISIATIVSMILSTTALLLSYFK